MPDLILKALDLYVIDTLVCGHPLQQYVAVQYFTAVELIEKAWAEKGIVIVGHRLIGGVHYPPEHIRFGA